MSYNSIPFLGFIIVLFAIYFLMPNVRLRQIVIFLANIVFYVTAGAAQGLIFLVLTSLVVYFASRCIEKVYKGYEKEIAVEGITPKEKMALLAGYKKKCRKYLYTSLVIVIGILVYIKVGRTFHWTEVKTIPELGIMKILVPLGISYYTFSSVGYLLDNYWRKAKCEHDYFKLLTCMTYFPHIVQGPIGRYDKLMKQFDALPGFDYKRVCFGLQLLLWGTFKKMVVADRLSLYTNTILQDPLSYAGIEIFLAVVLCVVQLYADFSGCMDMVCGVSQVLGVTLDKNFNHPFFSRGAAEFWRRWHITLGSWFKDYILMPIATNPKFLKATMNVKKRFGLRMSQVFSTAVPATAVWILTGLWHGTGKSYLAWGLYWDALIIGAVMFAPELKKLNQFLHINTESTGFRVFQMIRTFFLFAMGRMFTVTPYGVHGFIYLWKQMLTEHRLWTLFDGSLYTHGLDQKNFYVALFGMLLMWAVSLMQEKCSVREKLAESPLVLRWIVYYGAILLILIFGMYGAAYDASSFVYGGF